jgi:hypothetical protein
MTNDDPWAQYRDKPVATPTTPSADPGADPWAPYRAGAAPAAPTPAAPPPASSYDPNWKPPASTGHPLWDAINTAFSRPIAKSESPWAAMQDYGLGIGDYATAGLVGKALGPDAQNAIAQAHQNLGVMDYGAQAVGYGAGPGKLLGPAARGITSVGGKIAGAVAPDLVSAAAPIAGRVGSAVAGGLENAGAAAAGTYGHEQGWTPDVGEIGKNAATGAMIGTLLGGVTGGSGPPPKAPEVGAPGRSGGAPTGMYAQKEAAYKPLDSIYFQGSHQQPLQNVWDNLIAQRDPLKQGVDLGVPQEAQDIVSNIGSKSTVTGRNLQKASSDLRNVGGPEANQFADALDGTLNNAQPMRGSMVNGAPAQVGQAGAAKTSGDMWTGRIKDLERLGTDPGQLTNAAIKQTQSFPVNQGGPQGNALGDLSASMKPGFNWWTARHVAAPLAGAATGGLEGYFNAAEGQSPWTNAAIHAGEDAALFGGMHAAAAPRPGPALNAARYAIATGKPMTTPPGRVGDWLLNLAGGNAIGGQGASGLIAPGRNVINNQP